MPTHRNDWRCTMVLFATTSLVESLAFGHLGAFTPLFLQRHLHVAFKDVPFWTGVLSSLGFVLGLPLLPFWGVWANRYGRKLMIVRSSVFAAILYALAGASTSVWMLACARFLGGFVLGNTGIMMALQSDITPQDRLGSTVAIISAGAPVGMAVGPYVGGLVVHQWSIRVLLYADAVLTGLIVLMLMALLHDESRRAAEPQSTRAGVLEALKAIVQTPRVAPLFAAIFLMAYGVSLSQPYVPILIQKLYVGRELATVIGAVLSGAGLAMALATPFWGTLGDRIGHLRMLRFCALAVGMTLAGQALAGSVWQISAWRVLMGLCQGGLGALSIVLLALYTPPERRAHVLNMSLLPQQLSWFLGPLTGARISQMSLAAPFWIGSASLAAGWLASLRLPAEEPVAALLNPHEGKECGSG